jgi:hypothetical protein
MYKAVNFNIFKENLQELIYEEYRKDIAGNKTNERDISSATDKPIPKPTPDFWRPAFISKYINYRPKTAR